MLIEKFTKEIESEKVSRASERDKAKIN